MREVPKQLKPIAKKAVKEAYWQQSMFRKGRFLLVYMIAVLYEYMDGIISEESDWLSIAEPLKHGLILATVLLTFMELFKYLEIRNREERMVINQQKMEGRED